MITTDDLLTFYWGDRSSSDGEACLDAWLTAGFSLATIEDWWEAGIATPEEAQCLHAAGVRPTQFRMADWVWDSRIIDDLLAALAPIPWVSEGPASDTVVLGAYEAVASGVQCTVWRDSCVLAEQQVPSRDQARRRVEAVMRRDARQRLPRWERLEPAS